MTARNFHGLFDRPAGEAPAGAQDLAPAPDFDVSSN
jgi:hypothetical protein